MRISIAVVVGRFKRLGIVSPRDGFDRRQTEGLRAERCRDLFDCVHIVHASISTRTDFQLYDADHDVASSAVFVFVVSTCGFALYSMHGFCR